jgi:dihydrofolate reductase
VFVLSHHPREPLTMEGGTTFTFVTDAIVSALELARTAADDNEVAVAGGVSAVQQCLAAGLLDGELSAYRPGGARDGGASA